MKNLKKFEGKAVKNAEAVKGGSGKKNVKFSTRKNDFATCVSDFCL